MSIAALLSVVFVVPACAGGTAGPPAPAPAPTPASAGVDRLIVKYRDARPDAGGAAPLAPERLARLDAEARRQGVSLTWLRPLALGAQVLQLSAPLPPDRLDALLAALRQADPALEYVEPDRRMQIQTP